MKTKSIRVMLLTLLMSVMMIFGLAGVGTLTASAAEVVAFKITQEGSEAVSGADYTYENGVLTLIKDGTYTVSMADGVDETDHRIVVNANVTLTLDGVNINTSSTALEMPMARLLR